MDKVKFYKYHGTGNDFVIMSGKKYPDWLGEKEIRSICTRHFGVGADGLIFLEEKESVDFHMHYFNADGRKSSMCGNGGRCAIAYASRQDWIGEEASFTAIDGLHEGRILSDGRISLGMQDVISIKEVENATILDTGSPHYVQSAKDIDQLDLLKMARAIRYAPTYREEGINVNYIEWKGDALYVRTYERGVEDETLSCGTGVCASAIVFNRQQGNKKGEQTVPVITKGGNLEIRFTWSGDGKVRDLQLIGPATLVFEGYWPGPG